MGRKNQIEGQLNFLEMLLAEREPVLQNEQESALVQEASEELATEKKQEPIVHSKKEKQKKVAPGAFKECSDCWCATCEHSTVGGGVPRPFGDAMRACPSCELCVSEGKADVCVIGSAEEGCRYRAEKEGLEE